MRVIGYGSNFEIYGNDLQTYDKLQQELTR